MIHDITPKQYDNRFSSRRAPRLTDRLMICRDRKILVQEEALSQQRLQYPTVGELPPGAGSGPEVVEEGDAVTEIAPGIWGFRGYRLIWLFAIDETAFYGLDEMDLPGDSEAAFRESAGGEGDLPSYGYAADNIFRTSGPRDLAFAGITALQLYRWRMDHRFCGRCGEKMRPSLTERAFVCPECRAVVYPKICPAVIVAVTDGDRILVSRYAGRNKSRNYALIAGFAEIGEPIEDTVHREVLEEVGMKVKNLRFYKSQPWSFSDTLLMGFTCELEGEDTIRLDEKELAMAAWLRREELPVRAGEISLTAEMMENFRTGKL